MLSRPAAQDCKFRGGVSLRRMPGRPGRLAEHPVELLIAGAGGLLVLVFCSSWDDGRAAASLMPVVGDAFPSTPLAWWACAGVLAAAILLVRRRLQRRGNTPLCENFDYEQAPAAWIWAASEQDNTSTAAERLRHEVAVSGFAVVHAPELVELAGRAPAEAAMALCGGRRPALFERQPVTLAIGETVILLHPLLPLVGVSMGWRESVYEMTVSPAMARSHRCAAAGCVRSQ